MTIYHRDDTVTLLHGDALEMARTLPDQSADCIVTSPPYYGLRDYGTPGQYGLEDTPAEYVETMRALFHELRRVLTDDGTLWLNIGDSFSSHKSGESTLGGYSNVSMHREHIRTLPPKNLMGIPWRVAFALQDDGWILRNAIIWNKPNAMPDSVTDRMACRHEQFFMLTKSQRYWFDLNPIREPLDDTRAPSRKARNPREGWKENSAPGAYAPTKSGVGSHENGKNPGDVWTIATQPFSGAHFAVMPRELARRAIVAGCKPGGVVLDPFSGSGTVGLVALENGRRYVGIDNNADYLRLSLETRLSNGVLNFGGDPA